MLKVKIYDRSENPIIDLQINNTAEDFIRCLDMDATLMLLHDQNTKISYSVPITQYIMS